LQQRNCNGYKFQGTEKQLAEATEEVKNWDERLLAYRPDRDYQDFLRKKLLQRFTYRLDTNFAKIDRIQHDSLENFKSTMLQLEIYGKRILEWQNIFSCQNRDAIQDLLNLGG